MGDRSKLAGLVKGIFGSDGAISNISSTVDKALRVKTYRSDTNVNINTNVNDRVLAVLSNSQFGDNTRLIEAGIVPGSSTVNTSLTNFAVVTFWKKSADGATKTTIATLNTGNLSNVNAYQALTANLELNAANQLIANGGTIGYSVAHTAAGSAGLDSAAVYVVTRDE